MNPTPKPQIKITPDMMKSFKTLTCDCGGMIFQNGVVVKKISSIVSPTGKEENFPFQVLVCNKCGKIPSEMNKTDFDGMLPEEVLSKKPLILSMNKSEQSNTCRCENENCGKS